MSNIFVEPKLNRRGNEPRYVQQTEYSPYQQQAQPLQQTNYQQIGNNQQVSNNGQPSSEATDRGFIDTVKTHKTLVICISLIIIILIITLAYMATSEKRAAMTNKDTKNGGNLKSIQMDKNDPNILAMKNYMAKQQQEIMKLRELQSNYRADNMPSNINPSHLINNRTKTDSKINSVNVREKLNKLKSLKKKKMHKDGKKVTINKTPQIMHNDENDANDYDNENDYDNNEDNVNDDNGINEENVNNNLDDGYALIDDIPNDGIDDIDFENLDQSVKEHDKKVKIAEKEIVVPKYVQKEIKNVEDKHLDTLRTGVVSINELTPLIDRCKLPQFQKWINTKSVQQLIQKV